jgi:hypothetical protein
MFRVEITADAKAVLEAQIQEAGFVRGGIMILRQGPTGDVARSPDGKTVWNIQRLNNPWRLETGSFETYRDDELKIVSGMRVHLALIPREGETGVIVKLKDGEPTVEALGA